MRRPTAQGLEDWQLANLREMRRERDHAIATPQNLVSRLAKATSRAEVKWIEARQKSDFTLFAPHLEEVVNLLRDKAALLGKALNLDPYDALVDEFSPGLTQRRDRRDLHDAGSAPAGPDPGSHRAAGASGRRWRSPAVSRRRSSASWRSS